MKTFVAPFRRSLFLLGACPFLAVSALAQAPTSSTPNTLSSAVFPASTVLPLPAGSPQNQAAFLVKNALDIAFQDRAARPVVVSTAAALLPRLLVEGEGGLDRATLVNRWRQLAMSADVSRATRLGAFDAFFDVASKTDIDFARSLALQTTDPAARAGALIQISRAYPDKDWAKSDETAILASRAARQETDPLLGARALVFSAYRATELNPARSGDTLREASVAISRLRNPAQRDNLYAELVGAAARYDLALARDMAGRMSDEGLKNLGMARINIAEISQTTLTSKSQNRVAQLATNAAPFDSRALPFLLQLPPDESVLKAISATLPRIYVTARPAIEVSQLERIWDYTQKAPQSAQKDQLQSRLARLLVLKDLWRGRSWGKQLSWKGGRVQVGAFLKEVLEYRQSQLQAGALQDVALRNVQAAYEQSSKLGGSARAEAYLLLAGQILG